MRQAKDDERTSTVLALIPARGGSKSIPRKNLLSLAGRPLIAYSIDQARASRHVDRVLVSTDDEEIAAVARKCGAEVPFIRPDEYAQDHSPDIDVFRHALNWLREHEGYAPDLVVHLRPTGPVRKVDRINQAIDLLATHPEADSVRSVSLAFQTPYKMWRISSENYLTPLLQLEGVQDCHSLGRQQLPTVYWQNGSVDVLRPRAVLEKNSMCGDCVLPLVLDEPRFEIDYPDDIPVVEEALLRLQEGLPLESLQLGERHPV